MGSIYKNRPNADAVVPDSALAKRRRASKRRAPPLCWPVSGLTELLSKPSQARVQDAQWLNDESWLVRLGTQAVRLTVAGAAQVGVAVASDTVLLPVELRHVNHTASTNGVDFIRNNLRKPYNVRSMPIQVQIEQIAERVERLLLRHAELQRTNALLSAQVESLTAERDSFKSRLGAARARVDALLDRLPNPGSGNGNGNGHSAAATHANKPGP